MKILLNNTKNQDAQNLCHQQISNWLGKAVTQVGAGEDPTQTLSFLGVNPLDKVAHQELAPLLQGLNNCSFTMTPSPQTGVYFVDNAQKVHKAVFKLGEKRASMELFLRRFAHDLGLADHAVSGCFCTVSNLAFNPEAEEDTHRILWNGRIAIYDDSQPKSDASSTCEEEEEDGSTGDIAVGILQPFLNASVQPDEEKLAKLLLLLLAANVRDVKSDGIINYTSIDNEECFEVKKPNPESEINTDLPFLSQENLTTALQPATITALRQIVEKWDIDAIITRCASEHIAIFDERLESNPQQKMDEGNNFVEIENQKRKQSFRVIDYWNNPHRTLLIQEQVDALRNRLQSLKVKVREPTFSLQDLIFAADPEASLRLSQFADAKSNNSLTREAIQMSPYELMGRSQSSDIFVLSPNHPPSMASAQVPPIGVSPSCSSGEERAEQTPPFC